MHPQARSRPLAPLLSLLFSMQNHQGIMCLSLKWQLMSLAGEQTGYENAQGEEWEGQGESIPCVPEELFSRSWDLHDLMAEQVSLLESVLSHVFTGGCCAGVLRRDQTEANDPDGNETAFALCRSPQTSQTRPRPLSFFVSLPLNFLSFVQTFALYLSFSTFLSGLVSCHALAGCLWTDFTACQAIYKCLHFPSTFFATHPPCHCSAAMCVCKLVLRYEIKIGFGLGLHITGLMNKFFQSPFLFYIYSILSCHNHQIKIIVKNTEMLFSSTNESLHLNEFS